MLSGLHHFELCVSNGLKILKKFTNNYRFILKSVRETENCKQWVVSTSKNNKFPAFIITERKSNSSLVKDEWTNFCCESSIHRQDSVFNVALEIRDVEKCTKRVLNNGGRVIIEPRRISDQHGSVFYSVVSSCCGNVLHTLINRTNYSPLHFLPHFTPVINPCYNEFLHDVESHVYDIDHVTYVCRQGESKTILDWYSKVFGMERFLVNKHENPDEGLVIEENVGMRLKAMQYWLCAESGMKSCASDRDPIKFVIAESIKGYDNCHVETFLNEHGGPGVQHIGLTSSNIAATVQAMASSGVNFRYPPNRYYTQVDKAAEIKTSGQSIELLKNNGILLDSETDASLSEKSRYLMQIFAVPLFQEDTFFLEVIQRVGATGFGAGNIIALAKSSMEDKQEDLLIEQKQT